MNTVLVVIGVLVTWCLVSVVVALLLGRVLALQRPRGATPATTTPQSGAGALREVPRGVRSQTRPVLADPRTVRGAAAP